MSALMERALEKLRNLPSDRQDELAPVVMMLAETEAEPFELTPEDEAALDLSRAQAQRGEFATDDEMRAIWSKHGL